MGKTIFKYGLWAGTLFVVSWAIALISAVVASKGGDPRVKSLVTADGTVAGDRPRLALLRGNPQRGESWWAGSEAGEVLDDA